MWPPILRFVWFSRTGGVEALDPSPGDAPRLGSLRAAADAFAAPGLHDRG